MTDTILTQPAFLLHARPYRDSSYLLDMLTAEYGRMALIGRGARGAKSKIKSYLQPFNPLLVSWRGNGELVMMTSIEPARAPYTLTQNALISGLYLNEILVRLSARQSPNPELFACYQESLSALSEGREPEVVLRCFEKRLLDYLGYGLPRQDVGSDDIDVDCVYQYHQGQGFVACSKESEQAFFGKHLQAIFHDDYALDETRRAAKRLMRRALAPLLGAKPLKSRELFYVKD